MSSLAAQPNMSSSSSAAQPDPSTQLERIEAKIDQGCDISGVREQILANIKYIYALDFTATHGEHSSSSSHRHHRNRPEIRLLTTEHRWDTSLVRAAVFCQVPAEAEDEHSHHHHRGSEGSRRGSMSTRNVGIMGQAAETTEGALRRLLKETERRVNAARALGLHLPPPERAGSFSWD